MDQKKTDEILEYKIPMILDLVTTAAGIIGAVISRFITDDCDVFLVCGLVACFSFHNFAESHERYKELNNERNNDTWSS